MKRKSFLERLYYAFFPDDEVIPYPIIDPWKGTDDEFWKMMNEKHPAWTAIYPFSERSQPRVIHYHAVDGGLLGLCVRWPNRNYYYTVQV